VFLPHARTIDADGVPVRVVPPLEREAEGVYVHVHGGGWTLGQADIYDVGLAATAEATGLVVASIDYRLAPEHPYPAAPDDCERAVLCLLENAAALPAPARFAIGGESAGAHLAVVTLLRLRDRHGSTGAFARANLVFGVFDLTHTPSSRQWGDENLVLSTPLMRWFVDNFLPGMDDDARREPDVSPLYARLHDLPPALFTVGTRDLLLDDSLFMHARWRAAGNDARLLVYEEAAHGFTSFPLAVAREANDAMHAFLRGE
jgi:acetyl esterase